MMHYFFYLQVLASDTYYYNSLLCKPHLKPLLCPYSFLILFMHLSTLLNLIFRLASLLQAAFYITVFWYFFAELRNILTDSVTYNRGRSICNTFGCMHQKKFTKNRLKCKRDERFLIFFFLRKDSGKAKK